MRPRLQITNGFRIILHLNVVSFGFRDVSDADGNLIVEDAVWVLYTVEYDCHQKSIYKAKWR